MLFILAVFFILIGTFYYYGYSKELRRLVSYSKQKQLDIIGWEANSELFLMSNALFFFKLLRLNESPNNQDIEQNKMLVSSRRELLKSMGFGLLGAVLGVAHVVAH